MALFGPRQKPKKRAAQPVQASGLDMRFNEAAAAGGGIQPGAHDEEIAKLQGGLGNPIKQIGALFKKKPKKGSK